MTDPASYSHRLHALRKPRTYTLTHTGLRWKDEDGEGEGELAYSDIRKVHLAYRPTRVQRNRYLAHITPHAGRRIDISNSSYRGFGNFKEHNARYAAFITELHRRIAASGADVAFHKGSSLVGYVANLVLTGWIAAMIVLALVLLWATGWVMVAVLKLGIIAFFLPTLFRFIVRARPRAYEALAIPADALPRTD